ncbi:hypothetical protein [Georgenia wangjunii]|uniref:hypothetical protein n=1 Tax=Georgenia wangjunii TaxID=3117730 RepID=UPI002F265EDE
MAEQDRPRAKTFGTSGDATGDARRSATGSGRPADSRATRGAGAGGSGPGGGAREGSRVPWVALGVAAVLTLWQIIYSITFHTVAEESQEVYTSVSLFVSLILAVGAFVLGIVARSQHHTPRWPATAAVAIGVYVFVVCVASWIGGLMASPV